MDPRLGDNRENWDERVPIHVASAFYDVEGWLAERRTPRRWELDALGEVRGRDLVHLQCHFGLDTLALARAGARVTGVDFSPAAIAAARELAGRAGLADRARFAEADVLRAAEALAPDTFDVVYVSLGSLCWLPSVDRWAAQAAALLRRGGRLYVHDGHPLAWAMAEDDLRIEYTCFEEAAALVEEEERSYTGDDAHVLHARVHVWNHSIGEIVTAVLGHGLRLVQLTEHDWTVWPRFEWLVETPDRRWQVPPGRPRVPLSFTLVAERT